MKRTKDKTILLILTAVLLLVGAGIWYGGRKDVAPFGDTAGKMSGTLQSPAKANALDIPALEKELGITIKEIPAPTSTVDTSDWKTYRNEEYGFEVKYPGGWKIRIYGMKNLEGIAIALCCDFMLNVFKGTIIKDFFNAFDNVPPELRKAESVVINDIRMFVSRHDGYQTEYDLYFERDGKVYHFAEGFHAQEGDGKIMNAVVGSFKFIR